MRICILLLSCAMLFTGDAQAMHRQRGLGRSRFSMAGRNFPVGRVNRFRVREKRAREAVNLSRVQVHPASLLEYLKVEIFGLAEKRMSRCFSVYRHGDLGRMLIGRSGFNRVRIARNKEGAACKKENGEKKKPRLHVHTAAVLEYLMAEASELAESSEAVVGNDEKKACASKLICAAQKKQCLARQLQYQQVQRRHQKPQTRRRGLKHQGQPKSRKGRRRYN